MLHLCNDLSLCMLDLILKLVVYVCMYVCFVFNSTLGSECFSDIALY